MREPTLEPTDDEAWIVLNLTPDEPSGQTICQTCGRPAAISLDNGRTLACAGCFAVSFSTQEAERARALRPRRWRVVRETLAPVATALPRRPRGLAGSAMPLLSERQLPSGKMVSTLAQTTMKVRRDPAGRGGAGHSG
jgi:hypothetical protein